MKISIITVSFNAVETIEDTIQSVLGQRYKNIEYIIVDGKSTDGTQKVIGKYRGRITQYVSEPDKGIYDGMNKGINLATGDVIGILNADDVYANDEVITKVQGLFQQSNVQSLYADLDYVDANNVDVIKRKWVSGPFNSNHFLNGWMPPHPTFFVKKECYKQYGLFNTELTTSADYELMLRLLYKHKISVVYLPETIIKMRMGGTSNASLKNRLKANQEDRRAWILNGLTPKWFTLYMKPFSKIGQFIKWRK